MYVCTRESWVLPLWVMTPCLVGIARFADSQGNGVWYIYIVINIICVRERRRKNKNKNNLVGSGSGSGSGSGGVWMKWQSDSDSKVASMDHWMKRYGFCGTGRKQTIFICEKSRLVATQEKRRPKRGSWLITLSLSSFLFYSVFEWCLHTRMVCCAHVHVCFFGGNFPFLFGFLFVLTIYWT